MLSPPPYALSPIVFRFRALAALAGRLPLGGQREVALAVFLAARLAVACTSAASLPSVARKARASNARHWLGALTLPSAARSAVTQLADATSGDDWGAVGVALERLAAVAAPVLDAPSRNELRQLGAALAAG